MAGIGWKLQRLIDRGSLTGTLGAYLTGVVVTSAPWLLTTAVLMSLTLASQGQRNGDFAVVSYTVTIVYALTVVLGAPVQVVVSRFTADRLFERNLAAVGAPFRRALGFTLLSFAGVGAAVMALLGLPLSIAVPGTVLTVVVGAQWLTLSVAGGLSSPGVVLRAFGLGAPVTVIAAIVLERAAGLGAIGYLYGFVLGQIVTLVVLLVGILRALPAQSDESARLAPAFGEYRLLAFSSFAYHLSIWSDKVILWLLAGREAAALYTATAAFAWFSVIPAFAWTYVQIETVFYQRFRAFYGALEGGGTLPRLRERAELMRDEAQRILRGAALVQGGVTLVAFAAAPLVIRLAGLPPSALPLFRITLVGAGLQVTTLLAVLLLYYFDLRRDALAVSLVLLLGQGTLTVLCWLAGLPPGIGYALGCAVACTIGVGLVRSRMRTLLVDTFQAQPYGAQ